MDWLLYDNGLRHERIKEEHEILSDKRFFDEQVMSEKLSSFEKLRKLLVIDLTSIPIERFTGCCFFCEFFSFSFSTYLLRDTCWFNSSSFK